MQWDLINLEGESGTQLGIDLLERRYTTVTIYYSNIEGDYRPIPQMRANNCTKMARVFLLYLLRAYLFTNGGQTMFLRWLALFRDFERA